LSKPNYWVWSKLTETLKPDRKEGNSVPLGYLIEGHTEYFPYTAWVKKGYVEQVQRKEVD
jgi:hypothetical protein